MKLLQPGMARLALQGQRPTHIGFIMDGNGRWASYRGLDRTEGHHAGWRAALKIAEAALNHQIPWITFYALTAENWRRPRRELSALLAIDRWPETVRLTERLLDRDVRLRVMGRPTDDPIARRTLQWLHRMSKRTIHNEALNVTIAFNYSGQHEILDAATTLVANASAPRGIDEEAFVRSMYVPEMPVVDLVIRTGGEKRLSNFMLWHCSYAELLFTDTLFPDFTAGHFESALEEFAFRDRRFGGLPGAMPLATHED